MQELRTPTTTTDVKIGLVIVMASRTELMDRMKKHAQQFDVEIINDHINEVDRQ